MSGSFPSLGFDPAPGDVDAATHVVDGVAQTARALEEISAVLSGAADGAWRGQAAVAFRELLSDEFRPKVDAAARSFQGARRALDGWLDTMRASQSRARSLERQHAEAVRRAGAAHATFAGLPGQTAPTGTPATPDEAQAEADRAQARSRADRAVSTADAEVDRIEREARDLLHEYEELGRQAASRLQHAMDIAPDEPGFWQRLAEGVGAALEALEELASDLGDWALQMLEELAPLLELIGDIAGMLSTVLGFLAFVPALQILAVPALLLALVALGSGYLATAGKKGSLTDALTDGDVLMDAVGVVIGGAAMKVGDQVVAAARAGSSATATGGSATRMVDQVIGPPIETAASFFQLARSTSYRMGEAELLWRTAGYHLDAADMGMTIAGLPGDADTAVKLVSWEFGPLKRRPSAVA